MNILGHLYLSGFSPEILFGNFIGDFVDGERASTYNKEIYRGIHLHRHIDRFTNEHRQFRKSKKRLWRRHRHYSAVIVDIFYDHFLARSWDKYSHMPLEDFARYCYTIIQDYQELLPEKAKRITPSLITHNWLVRYRTLDGIERSLQGMARRARFPTRMDTAVEDLQQEYTSFENDFALFMPQMENHVKTLLST